MLETNPVLGALPKIRASVCLSVCLSVPPSLPPSLPPSARAFPTNTKRLAFENTFPALTSYLVCGCSSQIHRANSWLLQNPEARVVSSETLLLEGVYSVGDDDDDDVSDIFDEKRYQAFLNVLR